MYQFIFLIFLYFIFEIVYFRLADRYNIIDKPNHRSSHHRITIRGGGIIFPIAIILPFCVQFSREYVYFFIGLILIASISFLDDFKGLNSKLRLFFQFISVVLLTYPFLISYSVWLLVIIVFGIIGILNAYNFMDGINGITVLYSIVNVATLFFVMLKYQGLFPNLYFISLLAALFVFSFFNVRRNARCFSGDIGSISIAYILCYLILNISSFTGNFIWILFFGVYGIDVVFTIICRIKRGENIMVAHRSHFYQYLVNDRKWGHLEVALIFAVLQLIINICIIYAYERGNIYFPLITLFAYLILYIIFRFKFEGRKRLFELY